MPTGRNVISIPELKSGDLVFLVEKLCLVISCERAHGLVSEPAWKAIVLSHNRVHQYLFHDVTAGITWVICKS